MAIARQPSPSAVDASPSPPPAQPLTKRDVRRNRIMERLQNMIDSFTSNQHQHYRAQLQAVQVDMTLVLRADPYDSGPLDDSGEDIRALVEKTLGAVGMGGAGADEGARRDFQALAGTRYRDFVAQVNDLLEERDADLTQLHNNYFSAISELERNTQQKLHQAEEEHKALASTIRQRLVTSITKKRQQLLRDKEQLDIADSNAMLLHPNHFTINNPGSPGGAQNRKTRHLRHRAGSPGEGENGKRKRKAAAMEDEGNESPVPAFRLPPPDALGGGRSPFKDARDRAAYAQFEAPAYSLEKLFTEKELQLATATAQQATYQHFHHPQQELNSTGVPTAVPSIDGELMDTVERENAALTTETGVNGTPPPSQPAAAPEMERTTSHQVLTRGGARANPLAALSDLAEVAAIAVPASRSNPFAPVIPPHNAVTRAEKSGAPAPPGVSTLDTENDFEMMRRAGLPEPHAPDDVAMDDAAAAETRSEMRRQLLDQALGVSTVTQPYRLPLLETGPALIGKGVERLLQTGFAPNPLPAAPIEQRLRAGAANALAGLAGGSMAAALQGRMGGEPMSRTTSAGGASEIGESLRRVRGRLV